MFVKSRSSIISRSGLILAAVGVMYVSSGWAGAQDSRVSNSGDQYRGQLASYFTDKIMLADQGIVGLSKLAEQRSQSAELKQFAQKLVQEHTRLDEKLNQVVPEARALFVEHSRAVSRDATQVRTSARERGSHDVLTRLCMINHRAAKSELERSKQLLEKYQGYDFDMAFLGMQISGHTWLLSELNALDGVGSKEFQQAVEYATKIVADHLHEAETLTKKLEDEHHKS